MRSQITSLLVVLGMVAAGCGASTATTTTAGTVPQATVASVPATEGAGAVETVDTAGTVLELQHESEVRFVIFQYFRGDPNFVEGVNPRVSGEVIVTDDGIEIGPVVIRAETFKTEKNKPPSPLGDEVGWRDEAIDRYILEVADYPEITFVPDGSAEVIADGRYRAVAGDLTIRGITKAVTFFVSISETGTDTYAVNGFANVLRSDYGLTLPTVRHVTEVAEDVSLEFDFVYGPTAAQG
ncbi:MAG: YceI family protein [Acidimicrobiia bacterium]|nr:YceI family protein [Acidimicrobiia bacterium]